MKKHPIIFYLCFPLLAILACNAPIDRLQPQSETVVRPTIGPPPTLTPLSIQESESVVVTAIMVPSNTPPPLESYTPTVRPSPTKPSPTPPNALPTVTLNPEFENTVTSQDRTPQINTPIKLFTYYEWGIFNATEEAGATSSGTATAEGTEVTYEEVYREFYEGRLVLVGRGGSDVFAYYVNGERISGAFYSLSLENCSEQSYMITVQSLNSEPIEQEATVKAPCLQEP
ncbi:MAG: hypothetical protein AB8G95_02870 [Anaerolineae bacterium]